MRIRWVGLVALSVIALLVMATSSEAAPRHKRLNHKPAPVGMKLPAEVEKVIQSQFPKGKVTGWWIEEKGELEVFVSVPGSHPIEVVFQRKGKEPWRLIGFEYPVPAASLTPRAYTALHAKYKGSIGEVELIFDARWNFLGYQVLIGGTEVFVRANGTIAKDPL
jgi:hypothetical protein